MRLAPLFPGASIRELSQRIGGTGILLLVALPFLTSCGDSAAVGPEPRLVPPAVTLAPGDSQRFVVAGVPSSGPMGAPVINFAATGGTITADGLYTAGTMTGTFRVIATQQGGALVDTATVTVALQSLRVLASRRNLRVGAAVAAAALAAGGTYAATLSAQYNSVTPENAMKWANIHPAPSTYNFTDGDALVSFAQANGMAIHGHTLVWHTSLPDWLTNGTFTKAQLLAVLKDHITTVVGHYRGEVATWDVVNEVMGDSHTLRSTIWLNTIGPEYIDSAFAWAHRADPGAKLYLNDYGAESLSWKADSILSLVQGLRARGIPIDGVGIQSHFTISAPAASSIRASFARFVSAGFTIRVSEMDVRIADSAGPAALVTQGGIYRDVIDACLVTAGCTGFTTWGFTDQDSWIPAFYPGYGRALSLDSNYQAKPAFDSLVVRLRRQ